MNLNICTTVFWVEQTERHEQINRRTDAIGGYIRRAGYKNSDLLLQLACRLWALGRILGLLPVSFSDCPCGVGSPAQASRAGANRPGAVDTAPPGTKVYGVLFHFLFDCLLGAAESRSCSKTLQVAARLPLFQSNLTGTNGKHVVHLDALRSKLIKSTV